MSTLKKNFLYQAFYEILIVIMPLITSPYVSRVLGASRIGIYSYTYTIANYFVLFAALGIKNYGNREISRNRNDRDSLNQTFSGIAILHFVVSGIVMVAYAIYLCFFVRPEYFLYFLIQGLYIVTAFCDISWLFFGLEKFKITVTRNSAIKIGSAIAIFIFVKNKDDFWKYVLILALSNFFGQVYLWLSRKKYVQFVKVTKKQILSHLPQMAVLFIPTVAISLYNYMDKIMVGAISGEEQLGFYENSEKIIMIASGVIGSVGTVMMPRMANLFVNNHEEKVRNYLNNSMQAVQWISCAMGFGIAGVAQVFSVVFWGKAFSPCGVLVAFLAGMLPIKGFANVLRTQYLIPSKMDKAYCVSVFSGAAVNLVLNFFLIPSYASLGATIATIFAETSVCVVQAWYCRKKLPITKYIVSNIQYVIFGIVTTAGVYAVGRFLGTSTLTLCIQIIAGGAIYCSLSLVFFIKTKNPFFTEVLQNVRKKVKR